jgi:hypothetical protein
MNFVLESNDLDPTFWLHNRLQLACLHDTEVFQGPIYSYPVRRTDSHWIVRGVFCSLNCAKKYLLNNDRNEFLALFYQMCVEVYGLEDPVQPAPPACILAKYDVTGQGVSIETFRGLLHRSYVIAQLPANTTVFQMVSTRLHLRDILPAQVGPADMAKQTEPFGPTQPLATNIMPLDAFIKQSTS